MHSQVPFCYSLFGREEIKINQLFLVGRLTKKPVVQKLEGKNNCHITLAIKRQFKNSDGIYETDFITCTVWNVIAERVCEFCDKGDLISVKGRIQNNNYTDKDEKKVYTYEIVAEQISFMQSQNKDKVEELTNADKESEE